MTRYLGKRYVVWIGDTEHHIVARGIVLALAAEAALSVWSVLRGRPFVRVVRMALADDDALQMVRDVNAAWRVYNAR